MILYRPSFRGPFNALSEPEKQAVREAIGRLERSFGRPHLHSGLGIRPLGEYFEFRAGLRIRCLFLPEGGDLILVTVGNHDHVRRYIRG